MNVSFGISRSNRVDAIDLMIEICVFMVVFPPIVLLCIRPHHPPQLRSDLDK